MKTPKTATVRLGTLASVAFVLAACDPDYECGDDLSYSRELDRCVCLAPGTWVPDEGRCVVLDGGVDGGDDGRADAGRDACLAVAWFADADGDGHGDPMTVSDACEAPAGYTASATDCDDTCPECHPGGAEVCETALDEDCDGNPVTGCACTIGTRANCSACGDACGWACGSDGCNDAVQVVAGHEFTCALRNDGTVACWGSGYSGQIGNGLSGSAIRVRSPLVVEGLSDISSLAAGDTHICALSTAGRVYCWGGNELGQLGIGTSGDGAISSTPVLVESLSNVRHIAAGGRHTCAVDAEGDAMCWGDNFSGQLGNGRSGVGERSATPLPVVELAGITTMALGALHTCAIAADGLVWCWGDNSKGQLGNGSSAPNSSTPEEVYFIVNATAVAAGREHSCAIDGAATVACWGDASSGQMGDGRSGSRVISNAPVWTDPLPGAAIVLALGGRFSCAATDADSVHCWGDNLSGALGNGTLGGISAVPIAVADLAGVIALEAGGTHAAAVTTSGGIRSWGSNFYGQLGDGTGDTRTRPVVVLPP